MKKPLFFIFLFLSVMLFADSIPPVIKWKIVRSDSCSFSESVRIDSSIHCNDSITVGGTYNYPVSRKHLKEYKDIQTYPIDDTVITICMIIIAIMLFIILFVMVTLIFCEIVEALEKEKK